MRNLALLIFICVTLIALSEAAPCSNYTTCDTCYADPLCGWMTSYDCKISCVALKSFAASPLATPYRYFSSSQNGTTCAAVETCILVDGIANPSFEDTTVAWVTENNQGANIICDPSCASGSSETPIPFLGSNFVWFGGYTKNVTQSCYQTVTIPTSATHLSFYMVGSVDTTTKTSLVVYVDTNVVFRMDKINSNTFMENYHVMEIDIRKYADGETHIIKFSYQGQYFTVTGAIVTSLLVDYVQFINNARKGDTNYNWPVVSSCSTGCPVTYSTDKECDVSCNNAQCGFDNGECESLVNGKSDICYDTWTPAARTLPVCSWYSEKSCCLSYATISYVETQVLKSRNVSTCNVDQECLTNIEKLICAKCSPNNLEYYADGILKVCMNYANEAWKSCRYSYLPDGSGSCIAFTTKFTDAEDWVKQYGIYTFASSDCFSDDDTDSNDDGLSTPILIVIIVGSVAIVAVISAVTFAVWWFKYHRKKKAPPPNLDGSLNANDAANMMTVMPNGMVPGVDLVQEPVVYTDQFGNIIPQEQIMAMTPVDASGIEMTQGPF